MATYPSDYKITMTDNSNIIQYNPLNPETSTYQSSYQGLDKRWNHQREPWYPPTSGYPYGGAIQKDNPITDVINVLKKENEELIKAQQKLKKEADELKKQVEHHVQELNKQKEEQVHIDKVEVYKFDSEGRVIDRQFITVENAEEPVVINDLCIEVHLSEPDLEVELQEVEVKSEIETTFLRSYTYSITEK